MTTHWRTICCWYRQGTRVCNSLIVFHYITPLSANHDTWAKYVKLGVFIFILWYILWLWGGGEGSLAKIFIAVSRFGYLAMALLGECTIKVLVERWSSAIIISCDWHFFSPGMANFDDNPRAPVSCFHCMDQSLDVLWANKFDRENDSCGCGAVGACQENHNK